LPDTHNNLSEVQTRQLQIDHQLARAGWNHELGNLVEEFRLGNAVREEKVGYAAGELADYVLLGADRKPVGVVEAKRWGRDARAGERQAADYADALLAQFGFDPFIFLTNGQEHYFWDRAIAAPRKVAGFFTREDLERYTFQRRYRQALEPLGPDASIVERSYQRNAIKRVTEGLANGQRKFLLVMATGTGKTRTVIALVELLLRAGWVQRVLFLADRRELVAQAIGEFKYHIPREARARIEEGMVDQDARIHFATYPSMMQAYADLSPGYFDLIIADESHRSIYRRYRELFVYFDAVQLGLTATPTEEIDHNTFELFSCPDGLPTFIYPYAAAIEDGYLVPYRVLAAQTGFQIRGIKAGELPAEFRQQIQDQGVEISEIDFEGSDLERRVTNSGTNDALVQEFMKNCRKDALGTLPAKTILFAISHAHAMEIEASFRRLYPNLQKNGLAKVIDSHMERSESTLSDFKRRNMPRVAISVDMMDTGIDVPSVQNLVFAKPVFSRVKFWQMIGRGTRLWTDPLSGEIKQDFLIIDHWNNFEYFQINPEGETSGGGTITPLPVRLFRARLEVLDALRARGMATDATILCEMMREMVASIPHSDSIEIAPYLDDLNAFAQPAVWEEITPERRKTLGETIAPLMRFLPNIDLSSLTFELRCAQLATAHLSGKTKEQETQREKIEMDLYSLPTALPEVAAQMETLRQMISPGFWEHLDYGRIAALEATWAPLMCYRTRPTAQNLIRLNLPDTIASRRWIVYGPTGEGAFAENYREQVEAYVRDLAERVPGLIKLRRGERLTQAELAGLEKELNQADLFVTTDTLQQAYQRPDADLVAFLRHILKLEPLAGRTTQIREAFDAFIATHPHFTATQIQFLRTVRTAVLRGAENAATVRPLTEASLSLPPFSRIGAVDTLFTPAERAEIIGIIQQWAA
jgi:type I restriction enzyme R subunit